MSDDPKYNMKCKLKAYLLEKMNDYDEIYNRNKLKMGRPIVLTNEQCLDAFFLCPL